MGKNADATCNDCYFRCAGLCALPGDEPCPTFRPRRGTTLAPPPLQAPLVARPLRTVGTLASAPAAA
jgi:hypothetical protein